MTTYIVKSTIDHDGKRYKDGDKVDIKDDAQAKALIDVSAIETPADKKPAK